MKRLEGLYVQFAEKLEPVANARLHALCQKLLDHLLPGVTDIYPGYINLYTEFDANIVSRASVRAWVKKHLERLEVTQHFREIMLPTRYDGEDLVWVAEQTGLSVAEVIEKHSQQHYRVYTVGFAPGQPLMGKLEDVLYLPRRATPRKRVPANSVAIAVLQTCIYPLPTPGGWHLLGTALESAYDPHRDEPFLFQPGDSVRFIPREGETPKVVETLELLPEPEHPVFHVEEPGLLDLLVDEGRYFAARFGLARSGALDAHSARVANAAVGNKNNEALLELTLKGPVLSVLRDAVIGFAGFGMRCFVESEEVPMATSIAVRTGQRLSFRPIVTGSRAYLATAGGFDVQTFRGSVSPDLQGRVGRALRLGDVLGLKTIRKARAGFQPYFASFSEYGSIRLLAGPQATTEALEALTRQPFTVTSLDRMGVRLEGEKVPGREIISEPTPLGAVQITNNGDPIILLNDRGGIGGYAKPAVIHPLDLPLVAQLRPGQPITFRVSSEMNKNNWLMWAY